MTAKAGHALPAPPKERELDKLTRLRTRLLGTAFLLALILLAVDRYAALTHRPAADATAISIYTTRSCPYCERLRHILAANRIPYTEYDVEHTLQGQLGFWALRARGVPIAVIGPRVVYGYRLQEITAALRDLGYVLPLPTHRRAP